MKPKNKKHPTRTEVVLRPAKPLMLHDLTNQTPATIAAFRRRMMATSLAAGASDHARHHVARNAQS